MIRVRLRHWRDHAWEHWTYFLYVCRHRFLVFLECCYLGIPLQGVVHDLSKFGPGEWLPTHIHGGRERQTTLLTVSTWRTWVQRLKVSGSPGFNLSWLHHQNSNPHHWSYWVLYKDTGHMTVIPMPRRYVLEMVADWRAVRREVGGLSTKEWFQCNRGLMVMHPETIVEVEELLDVNARDCTRRELGIGGFS